VQVDLVAGLGMAFQQPLDPLGRLVW